MRQNFKTLITKYHQSMTVISAKEGRKKYFYTFIFGQGDDL